MLHCYCKAALTQQNGLKLISKLVSRTGRESHDHPHETECRVSRDSAPAERVSNLSSYIETRASADTQ